MLDYLTKPKMYLKKQSLKFPGICIKYIYDEILNEFIVEKLVLHLLKFVSCQNTFTMCINFAKLPLWVRLLLCKYVAELLQN